jgi:DNA-binding CsgD family transcriptional regulator
VAAVGDAGKNRLLEPFGDLLTAELAEAYRKLQMAGGVPKEEATDFVGAGVLAELVGRGLVRVMPYGPAGEAAFQAAPLDVAYAALLTGLLGQASEAHERILECISRLTDALAEPHAGWSPDLEHQILVTDNPEETAQMSADLISSARREWMSLEKATSEKPITEDCAVTLPPALYGQIRVRAVYDRAAAEHPVISKNMVRAREAGEQARVLPELPMKMQLIDQSAALLAITETGSHGAMLIRGAAPLLRALRQYFELLWERATPVGGAHVPVGCPLTDDEYVVLQLMANGMTDQAINNKLGKSKSTVQRRVSAIYQHLDVTNRFAAGMAVQRRGWLSQGTGGEDDA